MRSCFSNPDIWSTLHFSYTSSSLLIRFAPFTYYAFARGLVLMNIRSAVAFEEKKKGDQIQPVIIHKLPVVFTREILSFYHSSDSHSISKSAVLICDQ